MYKPSKNHCKFWTHIWRRKITFTKASTTTRMSEKRIPASMLYRRIGWRVTSATSFGSFRSSRKFLSLTFLYSMYSGKCRPACRNNHTGVRSTFWPLAARIIMSFDGAELEEAKTTHLAAGKLPLWTGSRTWGSNISRNSRYILLTGSDLHLENGDDFCEQAE